MRIRLLPVATFLLALAGLTHSLVAATEPGWLRARDCLPGRGGDTLAPPEGLGSPKRLRIFRDGRLLLPGQDYRILPGDTALVFAAPLGPGDTVCVDRAFSPLFPSPTLRLYRMEAVPVYAEDGAEGEGAEISASTEAGRPAGFRSGADAGGAGDSLGEYRLDYSGSKSMAVTMGSGGGLGLDAALYINLEGQVAGNTFIEGQLSDQNVPVQPEGNTATLKEVDTKFMRVYGSNYSYVLGNYLLDHGVDGEDRYRAKVQGVEGMWKRGQHLVKGSWSLAEGQYASDTLRGVDGKQRGYYLRGRDGRQFITVLAGTERLWRNGSPLKRGVDYTIDYSEGRVDFQNAVIVTSENLFSAEFQYTDQDYGRSLLGGEVADTAGAFRWSLRGISERENKDNPLTAAFDSTMTRRFAALGDDTYTDSLERRVAMPTLHSAAAANFGWQGHGHESRATFLLSQLDRNLYSTLDDQDNAGYSTRYRGSQTAGRAFDEGGWSRAHLSVDHEYRSGRYRSFKQLTEPRGFLETWNLDASVGESGFLANRVRVEERPWSKVMLGLEAGRAETLLDRPADDSAAALPEALSRRGAVFGKLGGERTFVEASSEAKLARSPFRRDNYRQAGRLRLEAAGLVPSFTWVRNEWLAASQDGSLGRSIKQEPEAGLSSRTLLGHLTFSATTSLLSQRSDWGGRLEAVRDSVRDWGFSQRMEVLALGPWTTDVFYSYRNHRQWRLDGNGAHAPLPEESHFNQVEWNNHLSEHRKGYGLVSSYRVSQTAELPLVEAYRKVPEGRGNYRYDSLLNAYHEVETGGDHILIGLERDTTLGSRPYQDLSWTAHLELAPARFPFAVKGVLADVEFDLALSFDHQDTSGEASLLPLFTDAAIEAVRSGRSRYSPSLHWKGPDGRKAANLRIDRAYSRTAGLYAARERRFDQRADYRQEVGEQWEYALEQGYENRHRAGLTASGDGLSESGSWIYGLRALRRLPRDFALEGRAQYQATGGRSPAGDLDLKGVKPALKLEKTSLYNGRAFLEYGVIWFWGEGEGNFYATDGFRRGLTHRMEANAQFQVGGHMHLNFDYVVRLEPGASAPDQKLTAEARAVF
jgi:hypothetical protein